ncbi:hypothetical protein E2C01_018865 [Portunus trituberculatus]|uniref:Uncharacterized protein n=1 Tax=Portunus trituberculatus TaxID=210409 RepID=A0A5B7DXR2_PORTR|nr:hypothetical protein [Portunus trituberculatus]
MPSKTDLGPPWYSGTMRALGSERSCPLSIQASQQYHRLLMPEDPRHYAYHCAEHHTPNKASSQGVPQAGATCRMNLLQSTLIYLNGLALKRNHQLQIKFFDIREDCQTHDVKLKRPDESHLVQEWHVGVET